MHRKELIMPNYYSLNDIVWIQVKNHPWWPGVIVKIITRFSGKRRYVVKLVGKNRSFTVSRKRMKPYNTYYKECSVTKKESLKRAIAEANEIKLKRLIGEMEESCEELMKDQGGMYYEVSGVKKRGLRSSGKIFADKYLSNHKLSNIEEAKEDYSENCFQDGDEIEIEIIEDDSAKEVSIMNCDDSQEKQEDTKYNAGASNVYPEQYEGEKEHSNDDIEIIDEKMFQNSVNKSIANKAADCQGSAKVQKVITYKKRRRLRRKRKTNNSISKVLEEVAQGAIESVKDKKQVVKIDAGRALTLDEIKERIKEFDKNEEYVLAYVPIKIRKNEAEKLTLIM
eukprot:TRINITY_DN1670_c0_g2_i1.p1 TRINITY_DN1670_c0_g2~~TRINITY_DN1670_c0_g2_i1.p1  ORF type:complete len:338 (-),score=67.71 TRINITY_DN1670_c0_g2_i1:128-1141(-)